MPQLSPENLRGIQTDRQTGRQRLLGARSGEPAPLCPPVLDAQDELVEAVDVLEAGLVRDREDDEEAVPRAHVLLPHGTELLLPGRVQNWGGMGQSGLSPVPQGPPQPADPTLLLPPQWLNPNCPHKSHTGPWAGLWGSRRGLRYLSVRL